MANDAPTNQRMDFGYKAARASGVTDFYTGVSSRRTNERLKTLNARIDWLGAEARRGWLRFILHWRREGLSVDEIYISLRRAQEYMKHYDDIQRRHAADPELRKALLEALAKDGRPF